MFSKLLTLSTAIAIAVSLAACNSSSSSSKSHKGGDYFAVVNMADPGYADADLALVDLSKEPLTLQEGGFGGSGSDFGLSAYGEYFYRIGRFNSDSITKYSIQDPNTPIYTYSTGAWSNPYELISLSNEKAYLLRYDTAELWVVNPSAENEADFKLKEIDLSSYDTDDIPEMSAGIIVDGKLYVTLEKLTNWEPVNTSSVLIINTDTDTVEDEIDLQTTNPSSIHYHESIGLIIQSDGDKTCFSCAPSQSGGIEKINLSNYETEIIAWDTAEYGLNQFALVDKNTAYVAKYHGWGNSDVFKLDLNTGELAEHALDGLEGLDIRALAVHEGKLWVSIADMANSRINLYNLADEAPAGQLGTAFYPQEIRFVKK